MDKTEQRIAIAEACGWEWTDGSGDYVIGWLAPKGSIYGSRQISESINGKRTKADCADLLPDYLSDLNAMHEAEKVLTEPAQFTAYGEHLSHILNNANRETFRWLGPTSYHYAHATAAQRAEAFLRTLGLWRDDVEKAC